MEKEKEKEKTFHKITVVIADDISQTREDIKRLLYFEDDITVVGEAADGQQAVEMAAALKPDVILMDINMPVMDGIKATEIISEQVPQTSIIIISIQGEQEYLRKAMIAGAREYLVKPFSSSELAGTIRRVYELAQRRRRLLLTDTTTVTPGQSQRTPGQIITIFGTKGGSGRTTIAVNLAVVLSQETRQKVVLVDLDLMGGDVAINMNINTRSGLAELVQEPEIGDAGLIETYLSPHLSGVRVLTAPTAPEQAELITSGHIEVILKTLQQEYDYIIVDTSTYINDILLVALDLSQVIFLIANQDLAALKHTRTNLELLEKLGHTAKTRLILNALRPEGLKIKDIEKTLNYSVAATIPWDEKTVLTAVNKGIPFVLTHGTLPVAQAIRKLAEQFSTSSAGETEGKEPAGTQGEKKKTILARLFSF